MSYALGASDLEAVDALRKLWDQALGSEVLPPLSIDGPVEEPRGAQVAVARAASVVVAAASAAAASVGALRRRERPPDVDVDPGHAFYSFLSERLLRVNGTVLNAGDHLTGNYPTADRRWIRLHCNFAHHRRAVADVLDVAPDAGRDLVAARIAECESTALEDRVIGRGGCAAVLRTREQWACHPHGRAVNTLPPFELARVGESPPRTLPPAAAALSEIRVLDLSRVIAGPVAARVLAAHGASVIRVGSQSLEQIPQLWVDTGFGKRSVQLDINSADDRATLRHLASDADVIIQAYRPGSMAARGFGWRQLTQANPKLICADLSAWGRRGPWASRRGFDSLVQMATGLADSDGTAMSAPTPLPAQALDHATGWLTAFAVIAAIRRRSDEGGSWHVATSLAQTAHWLAGLSPASAGTVTEMPPPDAYLSECPSQFGSLHYVRPPGHIDGMRVEWLTPPRPQGADSPQW